MAKAIIHRCQSCGGPLNVSARGGKYTCPFCGNINLFEPEQSPSDQVSCPTCGALNAKEAVHCSECGTKLVFSCPNCGAMNATGSPYCVQCGINFQEEDDRRKKVEESRFVQESQKKQQAVIRRKRVIIFVLILLAVFCFICAFVSYVTKYSPSARASATAEVLTAQQATQTSILQLEEQYPYHGSNGYFSIYLKSFCIGQDTVTKDWYVISHFLYYPDQDHTTFNWDFENSYLTDNNGNEFSATYQSANSDQGRVDTAIDPNATSVTLHVRVKAKDLEEIPIEIDLSDALLTENCGD